MAFYSDKDYIAQDVLREDNYPEELLINLKVRGKRPSPALANTNLNCLTLNGISS